MKRVWEKLEIRGLNLRNRFVRSATWEGLADQEGRATDRLADLLAVLARNQVGLVVTGFAYVKQDGKVMPYQTGVHHDDMIEPFRRLTEAVHRDGGRVAVQMVHGGVQARPELAGIDVPYGPSALDLPGLKTKPREMTGREITEVVESFGLAARRAKTAGVDAVQLHAAHGYLLNQFLSPYFNRRGDRYGGGPANRARLLYETYEAVRGEVGGDYPILIKINAEDFLDDGLKLEDSLETAVNLVKMGLDAVEVSGGSFFSGELNPSRRNIKPQENEAYFRRYSAAFKEKIKAPVILVGGLRSPETIEAVLKGREADAVALSRPFIREPDLVSHWAHGDLAPAACLSCGGCFRSGLIGRGISCAQLEKETKAAAGSDQADGRA
ncbi:MAG: NADH:flavin oxidoreductase [Thermodesulfobacteriota bacterium]